MGEPLDWFFCFCSAFILGYPQATPITEKHRSLVASKNAMCLIFFLFLFQHHLFNPLLMRYGQIFPLFYLFISFFPSFGCSKPDKFSFFCPFLEAIIAFRKRFVCVLYQNKLQCFPIIFYLFSFHTFLRFLYFIIFPNALKY